MIDLKIPMYVKIILIALAIGGITYFGKSYKQQKHEIERLTTNQTALAKDVETYKTKDGKNAAKIIELELSRGEFEKLCAEQVKTIEELNLKVKYLQGISTTASSTNVEFKTILKDSIIYHYRDSIVYKETLKTFKWNDNWNVVDGVINKDTVECKYHGVDTLNIVLTRVPKKFLFFKWGTKYIEVDIVHSNPSTTIEYSKMTKISN